MSRYKINCILPIYNVEKTINNTLTSIIKQSIGFENILLTIVDGKSTDKTKKIISEYQKKYHNIHIKYLKSNNNKLSVLKNLGIKDIKSKYVMILDSKACLDKDYLEEMYKGIHSNDSDICILNSYRTRGNYLKNIAISLDKIKEENEIDENILYSLLPMSSYIFNHEKLKEKEILFETSINRIEDILFKLKTIHMSSKINVIYNNSIIENDSIYLWELNNEFNMISNTYLKSINLIDNSEKIKDLYKVLICISFMMKLENISDYNCQLELFKFVKEISENIEDLITFYIRNIKDNHLKISLEKTFMFIKQENIMLYLNDKEQLKFIKEAQKIEKERNNYKKLIGGKKLKIVINLNRLINYSKKIFYSSVYYITKPYYNMKDIWLIGERTDQAEDNSYHFFKYCRINKPKKNIYYIIDKESPQYNNIKEYGNIIQYDSFKHKLYLMQAKKFISAYNFHKFSYPSNEIEFYRYIEKHISAEKIFIQHGVAMNSAPYYHQNINKYDYMLTSTQKETNMLIDKYKWDDKHIMKTGLARYDNLKDESKLNSKKKILFMPTWRSSLNGVSREEFITSNYYKSIVKFLQSEKLNKLIKDKNLDFVFYIHYQMQSYVDEFKNISKNITILEKSNSNVQQLLKDSNLLITDFSSVAIDFSYMDKPVIFYQFDIENFHYEMNDNEDFIMYKDFGLILDNKNDVIKQLNKWIDNKYMNFYKIKDDLFYNRDYSNCERIYNFINNIKVSNSKKVIVKKDQVNKNILRIYNKNYTIKERIDFYENGLPKKRFIYNGRELNKVIEYTKNGKARRENIYWSNFLYKTKKIKGDKYNISYKDYKAQ